jgi:hypothetical protein
MAVDYKHAKVKDEITILIPNKGRPLEASFRILKRAGLYESEIFGPTLEIIKNGKNELEFDRYKVDEKVEEIREKTRLPVKAIQDRVKGRYRIGFDEYELITDIKNYGKARLKIVGIDIHDKEMYKKKMSESDFSFVPWDVLRCHEADNLNFPHDAKKWFSYNDLSVDKTIMVLGSLYDNFSAHFFICGENVRRKVKNVSDLMNLKPTFVADTRFIETYKQIIHALHGQTIVGVNEEVEKAVSDWDKNENVAGIYIVETGGSLLAYNLYAVGYPLFIGEMLLCANRERYEKRKVAEKIGELFEPASYDKDREPEKIRIKKIKEWFDKLRNNLYSRWVDEPTLEKII